MIIFFLSALVPKLGIFQGTWSYILISQVEHKIIVYTPIGKLTGKIPLLNLGALSRLSQVL